MKTRTEMISARGRVLSVLVLVVSGLLLAGGASAQQQQHVVDASDSKDLNIQAYEELLENQDVLADREALIHEGMQVDEKQGAAFWPIYKQYAAEQAKLQAMRMDVIHDYAQTFLTMDDATAEKLAQRILDLDDQRTALRRKYFGIMKGVLPTVLVVRFFQLDNQLQLISDLQIASNLPIIEQTSDVK